MVSTMPRVLMISPALMAIHLRHGEMTFVDIAAVINVRLDDHKGILRRHGAFVAESPGFINEYNRNIAHCLKSSHHAKYPITVMKCKA